MMAGETAMHALRVLLGRDTPATQTSRAERDLLAKCLPGRRRIVEIGVFEGFTTRVLAEASDAEAKVYGVDPFLCGRAGISWSLFIARHHNKRSLATGKLELVRNFSTEVGDRIPCPVDFVFIDGDHSLEGITADWDFWSRRVDPGGIIALHDVIAGDGVPPSKLFGSHAHFRETISRDPRFSVVDQVDSLAVLEAR
jgi:predicted O-methyltransferase YrrM